jgi:hypothetical protein
LASSTIASSARAPASAGAESTAARACSTAWRTSGSQPESSGRDATEFSARVPHAAAANKHSRGMRAT